MTADTHSSGETYVDTIRFAAIRIVYLVFFAFLFFACIVIGTSTYLCVQDIGEDWIIFFSNYVYILFSFSENNYATSVLQALPLSLVAIDKMMLEKKVKSSYIKTIIILHIVTLILSIYVTQYTQHNIEPITERIPSGSKISRQFIDALNFITRQSLTNIAFFFGLKITTASKSNSND